MLRVGAALGRQLFGDVHQARARPAPAATASTEGTQAMGDVRALSETAYEDALQGYVDKITEAQSRGQDRRANRIYSEKLAFITARIGNKPAVGHGGRIV